MSGRRFQRTLTGFAALLLPAIGNASPLRKPSLRLFDEVLLTTAQDDFEGRDGEFLEALSWQTERLSHSGRAGPHLACAEYGEGRRALSQLGSFLSSPASVRRVSNSVAQGACFIATASPTEVAVLSESPRVYTLRVFVPLPSALKLAPGLLEYQTELGNAGRLTTTHGRRMRIDNVRGLSVAFSPGALPIRDSTTGPFIDALHETLMSDSIDLQAANLWSDGGMLEGDNGHLSRRKGTMLAREWTKAADVVHKLSSAAGGPTPGEICLWDGLVMRNTDDDVLVITGKA